jgi:hypothetical protein
MNEPSSTEDNGRDSSGRFTNGNTLARGNPLAKHVGRLRAALLDAVTDEDMKAVIRAMLEKAKGGNVAAAKIVLDRCLGSSEAVDMVGRIEELERFAQGET